MAPNPSTTPAPFLRWAGGKRRLLRELTARLPSFEGRYYEPFLGGGTLFFALDLPGARCVVNDAVPDVALTYQALKDQPALLMAELRRLGRQTDEASYYAVRASCPAEPVKRAARTIYLNRTCFNGLWRTNRAGQFNVSWGKLRSPIVCNEPLLQAASRRLQGTTIRQGDFEAAVADAQPGDFVYFDPPYIPLSPTASFSKYASDDFLEPQHRRLAAVVDVLTAKGVHVVLSNSDTPLTRTIYASLRLDTVQVHRSIAARGVARGPVPEVIGTNFSAVSNLAHAA